MNSEEVDILISDWSKELGFVDYGAAPVKEMNQEMERFNRYIANNYHGDMSYLVRNRDLRLNPGLLMQGACSIMCFLAPYKPKIIQDSSLPRIAAYSYGEDYHEVIKEKLKEIVRRLTLIFPGLKARVFADSAPILERAWGVEAGLGFIGKNGFLISKKHGLHTLIGIILTDVPLKYSTESVHNGCGKCTRCLDACPAGALVAPMIMDARRCISYQTIESKRLYSDEDFPLDHCGYIFGCDICLEACPWSLKGDITSWPEFGPIYSRYHNKKNVEFSREDWIGLSDDLFEEIFKNSPLKRAGILKIKDNLDK